MYLHPLFADIKCDEINRDTINIQNVVRITSKIINSLTSSESLQSKIKMCGTRTPEGFWNWCRSPSCDRCRKHRAKSNAKLLSEWADQDGSYRIQKFEITIRNCYDPDDLLDEINLTRIKLRKCIDRRQRQNPRWSSVKCNGIFMPSFRDSMWSASLRGVIHLGRIHEVTFLDGVEHVLPVRVESFPRCILKRDVYDHVHWSVSSLHGLRGCDDTSICAYFSAVNRRGGFKSLIYRRGFQGGS